MLSDNLLHTINQYHSGLILFLYFTIRAISFPLKKAKETTATRVAYLLVSVYFYTSLTNIYDAYTNLYKLRYSFGSNLMPFWVHVIIGDFLATLYLQISGRAISLKEDDLDIHSKELFRMVMTIIFVSIIAAINIKLSPNN